MTHFHKCIIGYNRRSRPSTNVRPGAIRATVAFLLPICIVYVNILLVQKGLS